MVGTPAPGWSPMILGSLSLRTVAGSVVPRGSGGGYSCSGIPLDRLHWYHQFQAVSFRMMMIMTHKYDEIIGKMMHVINQKLIH